METNGNNNPLRAPGIYVHKESGARVELKVSPGIGTPMIDAFVQAGFVRVDEAETVTEKPEVTPKPVVVEPTNSELKAQLIALGIDEKELKTMKKSELLAKLAEFGK